MLLLLFEIGNGRYALETNQIVEIVPLVKLKKIPTTQAYVSGLMNYRGKGVPVIDLCQLIENTPWEDTFSTRIVIINYPLKNKGDRPLGLIAGNVTETVRTRLSKPPPTGVFMDSSLYDSEEAPETTDMIQWFDIKKMLPEEKITLLFEEEE
ncbi:MAG: purine-binding chemotaxis protein CheW [Deltaproteobacteria bacterium]|jgi:chemotaxis-related protein WspB|nr:purine-binding chemotaxis protein CheW [Deltaproteobacteria bacterium]